MHFPGRIKTGSLFHFWVNSSLFILDGYLEMPEYCGVNLFSFRDNEGRYFVILGRLGFIITIVK